jgi:TPP-dependent indolepyruvate ferredoxin oxidoreductase alpha subunit
MVIVSADDPGPISSQTEQDTRHFACFSKLPVLDPSSPEEAYEMTRDAFEYSEKYIPLFSSAPRQGSVTAALLLKSAKAKGETSRRALLRTAAAGLSSRGRHISII